MSGQFGFIDAGRLVNVVHGVGGAAVEAVKEQVLRAGGTRTIVITSPTVADSPTHDDVRQLLGDAYVGTFADVRPHTPETVVAEGLSAVRKLEADAIVALGGGSAHDTAKAIRVAHALGVQDADGVHRLPIDLANEEHLRTMPQVSIPTTLSSAELSSGVGLTDPTTRHKAVVQHPAIRATCAIYDQQVVQRTPDDLWRSTGVKVLSDAVDRLIVEGTLPIVRPLAREAVATLTRELLRDGEDSRLPCQLACWASYLVYLSQPADTPLSAAIRHVLSPLLGIPHYASSSILLPSTLALLEPTFSAELWAELHDALGADPNQTLSERAAQLLDELKVVRRFSDLNVSRQDLDRVVDALEDELAGGGTWAPVSREQIERLIGDNA